MYNLYSLCTKFGFSELWAYAKEHLAFTIILLGCAALALAAGVGLIWQKRNLKKKKRKAEEAAIFLQTMEKEQRAREQAEAEQRAKDEETKRLAEEKSQKIREQELASATSPKKVCLFCGKENPAHVDFCEECAGKKFGNKEDFEARKAKRAIERTEQQSGKKKAGPVVSDITEKHPKYAGKWLLYRLYTGDMESADEAEEAYFFELRASNGEKLFASEEYTSYNGAIKGIETHKTNIANGNFRVCLTKKGDYMFKLLTGKNTLLCTGENYPTQARCESAIESTKRFAQTALIDENLQELLIQAPAEDGAPLPEIEENGNGKWLISPKESVNGEKVFTFDLYANNGEKLLSSEEYTSYIGAINGITTHKKNIESGNFRISLTKRGDYVYKLLNGNGQLLCLGEHYKTKRLCQNAVDSVKRFALSSPVLTDAKTAEENK
ncbi:MAG: DUF1508 domain-containing protein [Clostridia bacterium]|nr:DUF1508 domain-containing protein [Clostridia bacterium]